MGIFWKPNGMLDLSTESTDLPESGDSKGSILSGAMVRCKNLNVSRIGLLSTRYGSQKLVNFGVLSPISYIFEVGGSRYEFGGNYSYYNESVLATGGKVDTPTASPVPGSYSTVQTVALSCITSRSDIYFTLDGTVPNLQSSKYYSPIIVPLSTYVIFYAVDPLGYLLDSEYVTAYYADIAAKVIITENSNTLITETSSNTLTTEGG